MGNFKEFYNESAKFDVKVFLKMKPKDQSKLMKTYIGPPAKSGKAGGIQSVLISYNAEDTIEILKKKFGNKIEVNGDKTRIKFKELGLGFDLHLGDLAMGLGVRLEK